MRASPSSTCHPCSPPPPPCCWIPLCTACSLVVEGPGMWFCIVLLLNHSHLHSVAIDRLGNDECEHEHLGTGKSKCKDGWLHHQEISKKWKPKMKRKIHLLMDSLRLHCNENSCLKSDTDAASIHLPTKLSNKKLRTHQKDFPPHQILYFFPYL